MATWEAALFPTTETPKHGKLGINFTRSLKPTVEVPIPNTDLHVTIHQESNEDNLGSVVWDCGIMGCEFLANSDSVQVQGKRVMDLGSGTGLVGIACSLLGAAWCMLTDMEPLLPLLRTNVAANPRSAKLSVHKLVWGTEDAAELIAAHGFCDVIVCSDSLYNPDELVNLAKTLDVLVQRDAVVVIVYKKRFPSREKEFFEEMENKYGFRIAVEVADRVDERYVVSVRR